MSLLRRIFIGESWQDRAARQEAAVTPTARVATADAAAIVERIEQSAPTLTDEAIFRMAASRAEQARAFDLDDSWIPDGGPAPLPPVPPSQKGTLMHIVPPSTPMPEFRYPPGGATGADLIDRQRAREAAARAQLVRAAVVPGFSVRAERTADGSRALRWLEGGAEVTAELFDAGHAAMEHLHLQGAIHVLDPETLRARTHTRCGDDWSHVVVGRGGVMTTVQDLVLIPGDRCRASDFSTAAEAAQPAREGRVSADGTVIPAQSGSPGRPATDGTAAIERLVARGVLVPRDYTTHPRQDAPPQKAKRSA